MKRWGDLESERSYRLRGDRERRSLELFLAPTPEDALPLAELRDSPPKPESYDPFLPTPLAPPLPLPPRDILTAANAPSPSVPLPDPSSLHARIMRPSH